MYLLHLIRMFFLNLNGFICGLKSIHRDTKMNLTTLPLLHAKTQRRKVSFHTIIQEELSFEDACHSPDRSGNPFMQGFGIKDCNG